MIGPRTQAFLCHPGAHPSCPPARSAAPALVRWAPLGSAPGGLGPAVVAIVEALGWLFDDQNGWFLNGFMGILMVNNGE